MGKQIRFFIIEQDEIDFYNFIIQSGDILIDQKGNALSVDESLEYKLKQYISSPNYAKQLHCDRFVNPMEACVIEFERTAIKNKQLEYGRLWIATRYWSDSEELIVKDKWFVDKFNNSTFAGRN